MTKHSILRELSRTGKRTGFPIHAAVLLLAILLSALAPVTARAATSIVIGQAGTTDTPAAIKLAIDAALTTDDVTVTGTLSGATNGMIITIPSGRTLTWNATYSGSSYTDFTGSGSLLFGSNCAIESSTNGGMITVSGSVTATVNAGATIKNTSTSVGGKALSISGSAALTMTGGTLAAKNDNALEIYGNATVSVTGGTIENSGAYETIIVKGNAAASLTGGTLQNGGTGSVIEIEDAGILYVANVSIPADKITRSSSATSAAAWYIGSSVGAAFNTTVSTNNFTASGAGQNLFKLDDVPTLTKDTPSGATYSYTTGTTNTYAGSVAASFPSGLAITGVTPTPSAATCSLNGNVVTFTGAYDQSGITLAVNGTLAGGRIPVGFTTSSFGVNININTPSGLYVNNSGPLTTVSAAQTAINNTLTSNYVIVTGTLLGATAAMNITIPSGSNLKWDAVYSGNNSITFAGAGSLLFDANCAIESSISGSTVSITGSVTVETNTGAVINNTAATGTAMEISGSALVSVEGITIQNNGTSPTINVSGSAAVAVSHGTLQNSGSGDVIYIDDAATIIYMDNVVATNKITRNSMATTASAYYIGSIGAAFNTSIGANVFTASGAGQNLYRMDAFLPTLTEDTPTGAAYSYTAGATNAHTGTVVASFPPILTLSSVTPNPATATVGSFSGNTVTFSGTFDESSITLDFTGTAAIGSTTLPVSFTTAPFDVNIREAGLYVNNSGPLTTVSAAQTAINSALNSGNVTVTGALFGVTAGMTILIPAGKTLTWDAAYESTSSIGFSDYGSLLFGSNCAIEHSANGVAVGIVGSVTATVSTGATIKNTGSGTALTVSGSAALTVSGGTLTATTGNVMQIYGSATMSVTGGTIQNSGISNTMNVSGDAAVSLTGGTVQNTGTGAVISITGTSVLYVDGVSIPANKIVRSSTATTATAWYSGSIGAAFNTSVGTDVFTASGAGQNLFRLDNYAPVLTKDTPSSGAAYSYTAGTANAYAGSVVASFPSGLAITGVTTTPTAATNTFSGSVVTFAGTYDKSGITLTGGGTLAGGRIPVSFTTASFGVNINEPGLRVNGGALLTTVSAAQTAINSALNSGNVTVTGALFGVTAGMTILIPAGKTLTWDAAYEGSDEIEFSGSGSLQFDSNCAIECSGTGYGVSILGSVTATINAGADIKSTSNSCILVNVGGTAVLTVAGGTLTAGNSFALYAGDYSTVSVTGGTIQNGGGMSPFVLTGHAAASLTGGAVLNPGTGDVIFIDADAVLYVANVSVAANKITYSPSNAVAYYSGNVGASFNTTIGSYKFTVGTNLFRLDAAPALTEDTPTGATYTYVAGTANAHIGHVVANLPTGLDITGVTPTPAAATNNFSGNSVTFADVYDESSITLDVNGTLASGRIPVSFTTASFGVNLNIPVYSVSIASFTGGSVSSSQAFGLPNDVITLTATPAANHVLSSISAYQTGNSATTVTLTGAGNSRTFTMPAYDVTVTATFRNPDEDDVNAANALIAAMTVTVSQATANTAAAVGTWLAGQINALAGMNATGITVSASDITVTGFTAATAGTAGSQAGTAGSFNFTVSLTKGASNVSTAPKSATITATPYSTSQDNADIAAAKALIEAASYTATQAGVTTLAQARAAVQATIAGLSLPSGVTTAVTNGTFTAASAGSNGSYTFTVNINKGGGTQQTTVQLTLVITATPLVDAETPTFSAHPQSTTCTVGATVTALTVTASVSDGGTLSCQWYSNTTNSNFGGTPVGTGNSYTPSTASTGTLYYYAVVTNTNTNTGITGATTASAVSNTASVTVTSPPPVNAQTPNISAHPQDASYPRNTVPAALTVTASVSDGGTLSCQWYSNTTNVNSGGTAISGAIGNSYTPPTATLGTTYYYAVVTNTNTGVNGSTTASSVSSAASVTVTSPAGNEKVQLKALKATVRNGKLHVSGLTVGGQWSIYNISGALVYSGTASDIEAEIALPVRGVYVVKSVNQTVKVVY